MILLDGRLTTTAVVQPLRQLLMETTCHGPMCASAHSACLPMLKYRCDVAMSGRLGMEIQPKNMSEEEKALCRQAISDYKRVRPVIQFGDLYRLHSPYAGDHLASLMYVAENRKEAVFFWYKLECHHPLQYQPVVREQQYVFHYPQS